MAGLLHRLLRSAAAYQASSVLAALLALLTIPLYTKYLPEGAFGQAEALLTAIILGSIALRFGVGEAFVRFWFDDDDPERRRRLAHTAIGWTLMLTTGLVVVLLPFGGELSLLLINHEDATLLACGLLGLWAFTNLEIAYALLRVQELRRPYLVASLANVVMTVALTVTFVVFLGWGARGYLLGNYLASAFVLLGLWVHQRRLFGVVPTGLRPLLRFGGPLVPADAAIFALNVVDRSYLLHAAGLVAADQYAFAAKLSTVVIVAVRGFQAAWPPLAYSVTDHERAQRLYARVTTAYVAVLGVVVAGVALVGPWAVRLLSGAPHYHGASDALPWVACGWALYGLVLLLITVAGRAKITVRNLPAALCGLAVNVGLLVLLVPPLGIAGAGIALCAAYLVIVTVLYLLTRSLFEVPFEWRRLLATVVICASVAVAGATLVPADGAGPFVLRLALGAALPLLLVAARVVSLADIERLGGGRLRAAARRG